MLKGKGISSDFKKSKNHLFAYGDKDHLEVIRTFVSDVGTGVRITSRRSLWP